MRNPLRKRYTKEIDELRSKFAVAVDLYQLGDVVSIERKDQGDATERTIISYSIEEQLEVEQWELEISRQQHNELVLFWHSRNK